MKILGVHDGHNASACLLVDGKTKMLVQEERLRREKNFDGFPKLALQTILDAEKLAADDIDFVALNGLYMPSPLNREQMLSVFANLGGISSVARNYLKGIPWLGKSKTAQNRLRRISQLKPLGFSESKIRFVDHHLCHASSAYFGCANYTEPMLILTNDGAGDRLCATVSIGKDGVIERIAEVNENHSIGLLYAMFTFLSGMVPLEHEYKLMGMAPYADSKGARKIADDLHSMFGFSDNGLSWKFLKGFSVYSSLPFFKEYFYLKRFDHLMGGLQLFVEEFMLAWVKNSMKETGIKKLAFAGGTFMNVKANQKIAQLDEIKEVFIFPSCGDESNSFGAACKVFSDFDDHKKMQSISSVYWGLEWSDEAIASAYQEYKFKHTYDFKMVEDIEEEVANILSQGHVVGRFSGREEFGARSLGNRAIIANPAKPEVIKEINEMIKNRDFWMPFASSILAESMDEYVHWDPSKYQPDYMIMTYDTRQAAHTVLAGGIHPYDKTVRPQKVSEQANPKYWKLLKKFHKLTGIGGVLNTSLNLHGLPLVCHPRDAFEVIDRSGLGYLAIGDYILSKKS